MRVALVCIAKDEDNYIEEWVNYHKKLGFDSIFIYENDWDCGIVNSHVFKIKCNGSKQQIPSYNQFIINYKSEYDWAAFLDVDEFLVLKKHNNVKDFILDYANEDAIGVNWVFFGDNGLNDENDFGVLNRFTKRQIGPNQHIKSIVKLKNTNNMYVHNHSGKCVDTNLKRIDNSPFNVDGPLDVAQINHYFVKTKNEFIKKINRGRADTGTYRNINEFDEHNFNDVEDLTALNFYLR